MYIALIGVEILLAVFAAWCILNEKKLLAFEERTEAKIRRRLKNRKRDRVAEYLAKNGLVAVPRLADNEDIVVISEEKRRHYEM